MSSLEIRIQRDQDPPVGSYTASSSSTSVVFRKIEFHPARRPFRGFSNASSDFKMETLNPSSGNKRSASAMSVKKHDGPDSGETGLDPELSFGITFRKIGAGLENLGNTCFLNSVLQCLTYTEPLAAYLQSAAHQKSCHVAGFCALCAIQKHVRTALHATGRILAPKDMVSNLRCISRNFRNCRQEDAHEYMINLLECMHKCCLPSGVPSESLDAYKSSLVHKIFGGRLRSQVKCTQCSHCSNTFDPFLDLSLDIARADSLQKALSHFTAVELLDDGAKIYQCEQCKQKVKAVKQLTVSKAPYVLTVHFKRFEAHRSEKIDRKVQFGSTIDMKRFVSDSYEGDLKYTLYGVLVHYGRSIHSGHYACFIRTSSGMWYSLDDNRVKQVAERTVFDQKAYMLFYVRDRKNVSPKNAAAIVQKDNRASSLLASNLKQVNGPTIIKSCSLEAPGAKTQKEAERRDLSLKANDVKDKCILAKEDSSGKSTAAEVFQGKNSKPVSPFLNGSINTQNHSNTLSSGVVVGNCVEKKNLMNNPDTSQQVDIPSGSISTKVAKIEEPVAKTSVNSTGLTSVKVSSINTVPGKPLEKPECANSQVPIVANDMPAESVITSTSSRTTTQKKIRKPHMKNMYMGLKLFKLALGLRKKKHKRGKLSASSMATVSEELLSQGNAADQEPSTSQPSIKFSSGSSCSLSKDNSLIGAQSRGKIDRNCDSSRDSASKKAKRKRDSSKDKEVKPEKAALSILTRGLPETVVAKWDDKELPSQINGSKSESVNIGYVADEWDEEYDRGRRKKIKMNKTEFGGPNPFQMLTSKKLKQAETKTKWRQQMSTVKTAFRI